MHNNRDLKSDYDRGDSVAAALKVDLELKRVWLIEYGRCVFLIDVYCIKHRRHPHQVMSH